jgi:hypothetical protein
MPRSYSSVNTRWWLEPCSVPAVRYDLTARQFVPILSGDSATDLTYSTDGKWVAYASYPERSLWRSRSDGTDRVPLTYPPMEVVEPFISPDGANPPAAKEDTSAAWARAMPGFFETIGAKMLAAYPTSLYCKPPTKSSS